MKRIAYFFASIAAILVVASCAKQTLATKPYHNLTGRYNAYYNANMILAESFDVLNGQHRDNYNQILPLYPYAAVEDANAVKQPLDEAIIKSARNVKLHTIGNWTDDSYLLLGKAEFLQQNYERAANTFKYIVDKYRPEQQEKEANELKSNKKKPTAKKKKKKKRRKRKQVKRRKPQKKKAKKPAPKKNNAQPQDTGDDDLEEAEPIKYGIKHRPIRHEAMLWLAKTYIKLELYDEAGYYLRQLENDGTTPYSLRPEVQAVTANLWIQQKEYEKAIPAMQIAVDDTKQRDRKTRYAYIMAQLQQEQGNSQLAMEYFQKVLRLKPSYEMEFNARLNMAKNAAQTKGQQRVDPLMALQRLLRDRKNEEYKDQVYFAIAEIQLQQGNKEEGIRSLQQSLAASSNPAQQTEGALLLAQLYYEQDEFVEAYEYYAMALGSMDKKDERYANTDSQKRRLEGVATHLAAKIEYDSMLTVGSWERARQERWAIKGMDAEEKASEQTEEAPAVNFRNRGAREMGAATEEIDRPRVPTRTATGGEVRIMDAELQKSKFALYNPTLKKKGEREFAKRWDSRSWIDDWRRSKKEEEQTVNTDNDVAFVPKTKSEIDAYLKRKGVPMSDQERTAKQEQLATELFLAAQHYREDLNRKDKALELVNELLANHPKSPYAVEALFLAYNSYREQNNNSKAEYYKQQIINNYPDSDIAKVLQDPDYANAERLRYEQINTYYDETYEMLQKGEAQQALDRVHQVPAKFGKDYEMKARFAVLEAMCIGGLKGEKDYINALGTVATSYPNTAEEKQARAMIAVLKGNQKDPRANNNNSAPKEDAPKVPFVYDANAKHMVIVVFDDPEIKTNAFRIRVTNFNNKNYIDKRFSVSSVLVDTKLPSITIRTFANAKEAMEYIQTASADMEFMGNTPYRMYAISNQNYGLAMTKQQFAQYSTFFEEHYE